MKKLLLSTSTPKEKSAEAIALLLKDLLQTSPPPVSLKLFYKKYSIHPKRFWKDCHRYVNHSPYDVLDWVKSVLMIKKLRENPHAKIFSIQLHLGFESDGTFSRFTRRVFDMSCTEIKSDLPRAESILFAKYSGIYNLLRQGNNQRKRLQEEFGERI
jgi:methylphosphotriester-DNA--protein-cysteine methyltransferase